ncbi:MAG: GntR family transcriptional regulator, partial [Enterobacteriaceae bacterium]
MDKQPVEVDSRWLAENIKEYTIHGVASAVSELIKSGQIAHGSLLPTVKDLAREIATSTTTVSLAWKILRNQKMIASNSIRGRIWVLGDSSPRPARLHTVEEFNQNKMLELVWAFPDSALLPDFSEMLRYSLSVKDLHNNHGIPIIPELEAQVKARWPYEAEDFVTSEGGFDGLI